MAQQIDPNVQVMTECHDICLQTVPHCLEKGRDHAGAEHIILLLDCAEICQPAANFALRKTDRYVKTCGVYAVCAEVCERCALECQRFGGEETVQNCADVCRRCAKACRELVQHSGRPYKPVAW